MTAVTFEFAENPRIRSMDRTRTNRGMALSLTLHAALFLWIVLARPVSVARETLTEITLLGAGDLEAAGDPAPAPAARAVETTNGSEVAASTDEHFRRESRPASTDPTPQTNTAVMDRLNARLAAIQSSAPTQLSSGTALGGPSTAWSAPAVGVGPGGGASPVALHRGGGTGSAPLTLSRGGGSAFAPASALSGMPSTGAGSATATPAGGELSARRTLAGAMLAGPIADRTILHYVTPVYPEWAKKDGVEGAVTLHFVVRADGTVKENVLVQKTAGFGELDDNARTALREWRFEPLRAGRTGEQWGSITFHFRLRGA
ncbi:MAG: energy transducer TonB [Candidatus Eisenbacteria bacterium]